MSVVRARVAERGQNARISFGALALAARSLFDALRLLPPPAHHHPMALLATTPPYTITTRTSAATPCSASSSRSRSLRAPGRSAASRAPRAMAAPGADSAAVAAAATGGSAPPSLLVFSGDFSFLASGDAIRGGNRGRLERARAALMSQSTRNCVVLSAARPVAL